jgi:hypothetical protein
VICYHKLALDFWVCFARNQSSFVEKLISKSIEKSTKSWYQSFREKTLKENLELENRSREDVLREFDRLSDKIAQNVHFESLEDMEKFMRREELDPL